MKRIVTILWIIGAAIYGIQLAIFHDPNTTFFYILQDFAFLPISVAIATIVIGEFLNERDKKERLGKTQMLTSAFFTELGGELLFSLAEISDGMDEVVNIMKENDIKDEKSLAHVQKLIKDVDIKVHLTEEDYNSTQELIKERHEILLTITSNPVLLEHENFTKLLWSIFHLVDEFALRGDYATLRPEEIAHLESDFSDTLEKLLINWSGNLLYVKTYYPNYYNAGLGKLKSRR